MKEIIHPLGPKGNGQFPFIDGTLDNEANINFYVLSNMDIYAMVDGTIIEVNKTGTYANSITIKTNSFNYQNGVNLYLTYGRLGEILVKTGDTIKAGDIIAKAKITQLGQPNFITIFFADLIHYDEIDSMPINSPKTDIEYIDLKKITTNGETIISSNNLLYYIRLIFGQHPKLSRSKGFIPENDLNYLVAIVAQEMNWSAWGANADNCNLSTVAKTEAVCRTIRNRAYASNISLADAAGGLGPNTPYNEDVSAFSIHNNYKANIDGRIITFRDFIDTVCRGGDFFLVERYAIIQNGYTQGDLYSITGFAGGSEVNLYQSSNVGVWDSFCCRNWKFYAYDSNKTPPTR